MDEVVNFVVVTKRVRDTRVFGINVKPKIRRGESVTSVRDVTAQVYQNPTGQTPASLVVSPHTTPVTDRTVVNFRCHGGTAGVDYLVVLRYSATHEASLESLVLVRVEVEQPSEID